jgi:hypothetical protein
LVVGSVKGGYHVDSVSIAGAVDWPTITVTGHNHATNPHAACAEYTPSLDEILCGFGCAEIFANAGAASSIVSYTYTIAVEHKDVNGKDGNHLAGDNAGCMETVQAQYYGVPTLTTTGWVVTASTPADSNADFDVVNITASKALTRDATP